MADTALQSQLLARFRWRRLGAIGLPLLLLAYLAYVALAFDLSGLAQRARPENAAILLGDAVSYKVHVTRDNRRGETEVSIEGSRRMVYSEAQRPDWVQVTPERTEIALPQGHAVVYDGPVVTYRHPGYGDIVLTLGETIAMTLPGETIPAWINASPTRVTLTTEAGRLTMTRARTEVFRYFPGWELFFFDLGSPFHAMSGAELFHALVSGPRVDPAMPNVMRAARDIWTNDIWRHGVVFWAMAETVLMAFLGTFGAALVSLPLAFLAARNFSPSKPVRFVMRRIFDFVRGVDALIFTIILSRAFGPGPMTGALAMLTTDTGAFGKMFSEALENVDQKQIEGIRSTGASALQRYRFGVIPQVMPVLLSQVLYLFESNTRSATIIGAIVGGGIGLLLTQAIQTTMDWEKVTYYILLIVLMVIAMDALSGWLRRKLIRGETGR